MTGVTFTTMETVGIRTYTFEVTTPAKLADLTSDLVRNLDAQGGTLVTMEVNQMRYIEYREPKQTSGATQKVVGIIGVFGFLAMLGIAGWIEGLG